jgi:F420-dependent oxidoreductase-like protein
VKLRILIEPQQGATYFEVLGFAREAEALAFDALFSSDHYLHIGEGPSGPGPCDAWTTMAGLARDTKQIRIGTMMTPTTFRSPGPLAVAVAQVDLMSAGRVELGLGAGWYEPEHRAYGIPFPAVGTRFELLEEQLGIIHGLWTTPRGELFSFHGKHYELVDSPALPKPVQVPHPPILLGGTGAKLSPRLAAQYANEYNVPVRSLDVTRQQFDRVTQACEAAGRDPASITLSATQTLCVGETPAYVARRAAKIGRSLEELDSRGVVGSVDEVLDKIGRFGEIGARRLYLQVIDIFDTDHLQLAAQRILPHLPD